MCKGRGKGVLFPKFELFIVRLRHRAAQTGLLNRA